MIKFEVCSEPNTPSCRRHEDLRKNCVKQGQGLCKTQVVYMTQQIDTPEYKLHTDKGIPSKKKEKNFSQNRRFLYHISKLNSLC